MSVKWVLSGGKHVRDIRMLTVTWEGEMSWSKILFPSDFAFRNSPEKTAAWNRTV
jgi:hypothetical protein